VPKVKIIIEQEKDEEYQLRRKVRVILDVYASDLRKKGHNVTVESRWKTQ
jgi:hypothetical protein